MMRESGYYTYADADGTFYDVDVKKMAIRTYGDERCVTTYTDGEVMLGDIEKIAPIDRWLWMGF